MQERGLRLPTLQRQDSGLIHVANNIIAITVQIVTIVTAACRARTHAHTQQRNNGNKMQQHSAKKRILFNILKKEKKITFQVGSIPWKGYFSYFCFFLINKPDLCMFSFGSVLLVSSPAHSRVRAPFLPLSLCRPVLHN